MGLIGLEQAVDDLATDEVLVDDLGDVGDRHVAVPDLFGIDDDADAVLALVEAAGVIGADDLGDAPLLELGLELVADLDAALGLATALGVIRGSLVDADEDVATKTWR
jgi:hypothetical protein